MRLFAYSLALLASSGLAAAQEMAAPVQDVLSSLSKYNDDKKPSGQRVAFELPDVVVNSYLAMVLRSQGRPGIESASARFLAGNRVAVDAKLDFDAIRAKLPEERREQLKGTLPATVEAKFQVVNGALALTVEKFLVDGKPLPAPLAADVMRHFAALQPEKFDTSKPVPLPFGLHQLSTGSGVISGDTSRKGGN